MRKISSKRGTGLLWVVLGLLVAPIVAQANWLGGIEFTQPSPTFMPNNERIYMSIDYKVTDPDGARIFVIPYSEGAPVPTFGVSGSPLFPSGSSGTYDTAYFTVMSGDYYVDQVRVYMTDADQEDELIELFVRTNFFFGPSGIYNIEFNVSEYSHLQHGQQLEITFDYATIAAADVRIFARPYTFNNLTPGYSASGSALLPPSGSGSQNFTFHNDDADVTHVRFRMTNGDQSEELLVFFVPIRLFWREVGVTNITFDWSQPSSLHYNDDVTVSFDYSNPQAYDIRIWFHAFNDGDYAPGSSYQGSAALPPGSGSATRTFSVFSGETDVDAARLLVRDANQTFDLINTQIPVRYHWGPHAVNNITLVPERPAILDNTEQLDIAFDYETNHGGDVLIFARPFYRGGLAGGYYASGSPYYPTGAGSGTGYIGYDSGSHEVDAIRFEVKNDDQTETLFTWFHPARHFWGPSGVLVPAPENGLPRLTAVGQNYPNPFNPTTTIPITVQQTGRIRINAYDLRGRLVRVIADEIMAAGHHEITFDGQGLPSGTYFYRLEGVGVTDTKRMTLLK